MANKRNVRFAQAAVKCGDIQAKRTKIAPYRAQIYAAPRVRAIKFYADFGKIMKFCVEFRCDFASRRNLV